MKLIFVVVAVVALSGCRAVTNKTLPTTGAEFHRADYSLFTAPERDSISAARRAIRTTGKMPKGGSEDAFYRVRRTDRGVEVFVIYVTGYDGSKPIFTPCVHNAVSIRDDGSNYSVLAGPECWP